MTRPSRYAGRDPRPRSLVATHRSPLIVTCSCSKCRLASELTLVDSERMTPSTVAGARWDCPRCKTDNRLPALGVVTAIAPV